MVTELGDRMRVREERLEREAEQFAAQAALSEHLGLACVRGLQTRLRDVVIIDAFQNNRAMKGYELLSAGLALAAWIRRNIPEPRVAVVLPPGIGSALANLGCVFAGKTPVNLNFTAGRAALESAVRQAEVETALSSDPFAAKFKEFPWPARRFDLATVLKTIGKVRIGAYAPLVFALPATAVAMLCEVPLEGGDAEAALLFTSGSSGEPKGVVLTHRNILGNVMQVNQTLHVKRLLGSLPIFHSFGFTVMLWWPMSGGPSVVTHISPLDTGRLAEIVEEHGTDLIVTTPTFLRGFLRKARPEQLRAAKIVVTGAEKLPVDLAEEFEAKFDVAVREGYGLTETSPVISVNLLEPDEHRRGSVGRMLPGIAARVHHPETGERLPLDETGILSFKGANIFQGYLNDSERTAAVLDEDGWFQTGDLGRLDADGFLHIEGRVSRFSKIGGEMVPHGTIEERLHELFPQKAADDESAPLVRFAVCGKRCADRGEELVVLATEEVDPQTVGKRLRDAGLPNLWIPRTVKRVDTIPLLASGKLDLRRCREMVES